MLGQWRRNFCGGGSMGGSHGEKVEREEKWEVVKEYRNKMRNKSDPV